MAYTKTTWRNNQSPAINADNLNKIETGIYQCSVDTVAGVSLSGSGNNLVITISNTAASQLATFMFDAVSWLAASAFYTQDYIDACFTEVTVQED